jgi:hypothetical protein
MTDPVTPPPDRPGVVQHTTINTPSPRGGGGSWIALLVGGLVVVVVIIAFVALSNGGMPAPGGTDIDVDIDLPRPELPDAPTVPDLPDVPQIEPPTMPLPEPAPAT